jgi:hypothetical protein
MAGFLRAAADARTGIAEMMLRQLNTVVIPGSRSARPGMTLESICAT